MDTEIIIHLIAISLYSTVVTGLLMRSNRSRAWPLVAMTEFALGFEIQGCETLVLSVR